MCHERTECMCCKMSDLCFLCFTLFYILLLSRKESANTGTGWCNYFLRCCHGDSYTEIFTINTVIFFSECSSCLKAIIIFKIKQFSSLNQHLLIYN